MEEKTYRIGEAAKLLNLKTYVLRFWETEFSQLAPHRTGKGQRLYTERDIALLRTIRHLLHERGLTIEGARRFLSEQGVEQGGDWESDDLPDIAEGQIAGEAHGTMPSVATCLNTDAIAEAVLTALRRTGQDGCAGNDEEDIPCDMHSLEALVARVLATGEGIPPADDADMQRPIPAPGPTGFRFAESASSFAPSSDCLADDIATAPSDASGPDGHAAPLAADQMTLPLAGVDLARLAALAASAIAAEDSLVHEVSRPSDSTFMVERSSGAGQPTPPVSFEQPRQPIPQRPPGGVTSERVCSVADRANQPAHGTLPESLPPSIFPNSAERAESIAAVDEIITELEQLRDMLLPRRFR